MGKITTCARDGLVHLRLHGLRTQAGALIVPVTMDTATAAELVACLLAAIDAVGRASSCKPETPKRIARHG